MDNKYFEYAFKCAEKAFSLNEVPVGAVIVKNDVIISTGYNKKESSNSVLDHAEIIAIKKAEKKLNNWRLDGCELYVTLDPCAMCASAIKQSRIKTVYSALSNSDNLNLSIIESIFKCDNINPEVKLYTNLAVDKSKKLLSSFFEIQRMK